MTTLLQKITADRAARREKLRLALRARLRNALREVLPGTPVTVFGSLTRQGDFTESSDIDLALETEPESSSLYQVIAQLSERLDRRVDVVLLPECRFSEKLRREGETWTASG
jgi:predicted nucleotidyltransferase